MPPTNDLIDEPTGGASHDRVEELVQFLRNYYREEIGVLAQRYPSEQRALEVEYGDLFSANRDIAEDYLDSPEQIQQDLDEALFRYDLPADISLRGTGDDPPATVRVIGLPEDRTFYPAGTPRVPGV